MIIFKPNGYSENMFGAAMRRRKDISNTYYKADKGARFDYLYDKYSVRKTMLSLAGHKVIYKIQMILMESYWEDYCKEYFGKHSGVTDQRIMECLDSGKPIDCLPEGMEIPEELSDYYRNYCLMKLEFEIFTEHLETMGIKDGNLLRRYISEEISLWDIADEYNISYETAKGKIRDLKKALKTRTIASFVA